MQTDRHDKANGRFSQFCERVFKKKKRQKLKISQRPATNRYKQYYPLGHDAM